jgi:aryl-alcohol dehydrogenase-like predicted oxidoreductase
MTDTLRYRVLGQTGIQVSVQCLGAMMFGAVGNPDHDDCIRIIHAALDRGINFVDTADMYSSGESEEIVGKALQGRRAAPFPTAPLPSATCCPQPRNLPMVIHSTSKSR